MAQKAETRDIPRHRQTRRIIDNSSTRYDAVTTTTAIGSVEISGRIRADRGLKNRRPEAGAPCASAGIACTYSLR